MDDQDKEVVVGKTKVKIIRSLCTGDGVCVSLCPNTFVLDQENKSMVKEGSNESLENLKMAAQSCPTQAIIVTEIK